MTNFFLSGLKVTAISSFFLFITYLILGIICIEKIRLLIKFFLEKINIDVI